MPPIDDVLSETGLQALRQAYSEAEMTGLLSAGIPGLDKDAFKYIATIRRQFYDGSRRKMEPRDRERVLIGILASRDAGLNLALHVYVGLMENLSPHDIADIIFLSGIYTGVDCMSDGLGTVARTLDVLSQLAHMERYTVKDVASELRSAFKPDRHKVGAK
jgi:hypothetical protein